MEESRGIKTTRQFDMSEYWYPFFPSEYKKATRHLTAEQDGIYRRLIDEYMETREPLPDDDIALARIAGVNENKWLDAKRIVIAFFTHTNGTISHEFCDQQLDIQDKRAKRRSESAEKAAKKRWENNKLKQELKCGTHTPRNATRMRRNATDTDTSTDIKNKKKNIIKKEKPDSVSESVWKDFIKHRKAKKAPVTETVLSRIQKEADKAGWKLEDVLAEICARGWQGFKAEWVQNDHKKGNGNEKSTYHERIEAAGNRGVAKYMADWEARNPCPDDSVAITDQSEL